MRLLVVGDVHIKTTNIKNIDRLTRFLVDTVTEQHVDAVVLLGDVLDYHEKVITTCLNRAYALIEGLSRLVKTYVIVGNHDYISNTQFLTDNHWMNALKKWDNVVIVDRVLVDNGYTFCPYVYPGRFIEALATVPGSEKSRIVFCHQEFRGCDMGIVKSTVGDDPGTLDTLVISGHIHDNQRLRSNIHYVGSPMQHTFAERERRVVYVVDGTDISEVRVNIGLKKSVAVDVSGAKDIDPARFAPDTDVRVIVSGSVSECKAFKKTSKFRALGKTCKVVFRVHSTAAQTPRAKTHSFRSVVEQLIAESPRKEKMLTLFETINE